VDVQTSTARENVVHHHLLSPAPEDIERCNNLLRVLSPLIDGLTMAAIGVMAGGLLGWGLSRLAGNYVQELRLPGPVPLMGSAAVILMVAVLASVIPAARAARVDTVEALRAD
jgi:hypothetical protein